MRERMRARMDSLTVQSKAVGGADRGHRLSSDCLEGVIAHFEDNRVVLEDGIVGDLSFAQTKLLGAFFVQSKAANL